MSRQTVSPTPPLVMPRVFVYLRRPLCRLSAAWYFVSAPPLLTPLLTPLLSSLRRRAAQNKRPARAAPPPRKGRLLRGVLRRMEVPPAATAVAVAPPLTPPR